MPRSIEIYRYNEQTIVDAFRELLTKTDWNVPIASDNVEITAEEISKTMLSTTEKTIPSITDNIRSADHRSKPLPLTRKAKTDYANMKSCWIMTTHWHSCNRDCLKYAEKKENPETINKGFLNICNEEDNVVLLNIGLDCQTKTANTRKLSCSLCYEIINPLNGYILPTSN